MEPREDVRTGMVVRDSEGVRLGRVVGVGSRGFVVEKGTWILRDRDALFEQVFDVRAGEVLLNVSRELFEAEVPLTGAA